MSNYFSGTPVLHAKVNAYRQQSYYAQLPTSVSAADPASAQPTNDAQGAMGPTNARGGHAALATAPHGGGGGRSLVAVGRGFTASQITHFFPAGLPRGSVGIHPAAAHDCVTLSLQDCATENFCVQPLAHAVFRCTRFADLTFSLDEVLRCGEKGGVALRLFAPHMFPTVGDVLGVVDDGEDVTPDAAKALVAGDFSSATTMAACLRALRDTHVFTRQEDSRVPCHNAVVLHGARIKQLTTTFPLPLGVCVTGVRNKVATADACYADVFTAAGSAMGDEDLDVVRHSCSDADYASYVGVHPSAEAAQTLRDNADADHKDRYVPTDALNLFLQDFVDAHVNAGGADPMALNRDLAAKGVLYDAANPMVSTLTKRGVEHVKTLLEQRRGKMPIYDTNDVMMSITPACVGGWSGAADALGKSYAGFVADDTDARCTTFTVTVAVELDVCFPELAYALHGVVGRKYQAARSERRAAKQGD